MIKIIDCPRDAMQGIKEFIPTGEKIKYLNQLLKVGFYTLDFGSFVSPKAIPQLSDTAKVVEKLNLENTKTKLLAIVVNERGARDASEFDKITYLGYPFSISNTFQLKNTNATIADSIKKIENILSISNNKSKKLVVYIAMGFGNPYLDEWNISIVYDSVKVLYDMGIKTIIFSDTVGVSTKSKIKSVFGEVMPDFPEIEFGAHFHTNLKSWKEKIETAYDYGCKRFDGALKGYGGCPMSGYGLVGNMPTENIISFMKEKNEKLGLNEKELVRSMEMAKNFFPSH